MQIDKLVAHVTCATLFVFTTVAMNAQEEHAGSLSALGPPSRTVTFQNVSPQKSTWPVFSHSYLIQYRHITTSPNQPNIFLYNSSGELEQQITVWPMGVTKLFIASVDVGLDKRLAFSGQITRSDKSKDRFIAIAGIDGKNPRFFSTGNYMASQISIADDETIWSTGAEEATLSTNGDKRWTNYDMLRHFSSDGVLLGHFIPRWGTQASYAIAKQGDDNSDSKQSGVDDTVATGGATTHVITYDENGNILATYGAPLWGPQGGFAGTAKVSQSWLKSVGSRLVLYDGRSGILYSYDASNRTLQTQGVDISHNQGMQINGFAISSDGIIIASMEANYGKHPSSFGMFQLVADPSGGLSIWSKVKPSKSKGRQIGGQLSVLGSDGTAIVYLAGTGLVNWSTLQ
jgi:hypothetical protein